MEPRRRLVRRGCSMPLPNDQQRQGPGSSRNRRRLRLHHGGAMIWMAVRRISVLTPSESVFRTCSTHDRKRSTRRRTNSRRHRPSRGLTRVCTTGVPTPRSRRSNKTILRRRLSRNRLLVLTHAPTKHPSHPSPQKPALWGRLLLNRLRRPSRPPTTRTRPRECPGTRGAPDWCMTCRSGPMLRTRYQPRRRGCGTFTHVPEARLRHGALRLTSRSS